jgi:prolyl-tRNA synthetase
MRGREFLMKDAYSFDLDEAGARLSYNKMFVAYLRTFSRMGLQAIPMQADTGPIGGNLSHEFIVLAPTGESEVFYDAELLKEDRLEDLMAMFVDDADDEVGAYDQVIAHYTTRYAATAEKRDEYSEAFTTETSELCQSRGIEVGHIFYFGDKYSAAMDLKVSGQDGSPVVPHMGSYGVGVSRLVGAIIEASHDEAGIVWPEAVAPWRVGLVTMRADDEPSTAAAEQIYRALTSAGIETLYDDRDERGGVKLGSMDLIGLPWQVIVGPRGIAAGTVELKRRSTGEREELSLESALTRLTA